MIISLESCYCSRAYEFYQSYYLSSGHWTASDANTKLLDNSRTFHYIDYFLIGGICTCLGVSTDPMFLQISSNSCPWDLLLVGFHPAEIVIVKCLIQGRNSVTRVRVKPRLLFDQGHHKNDAFAILAMLPTILLYEGFKNFLGKVEARK